MDFNIKEPSHIIALFLLSLSLLMFVVVPLLTFFDIFGDVSGTTTQINQFSDFFKIIFEIFTLVLQFVLVIFLFVLVPLVWYKLVNKFSISEIMHAIHLKKEKLDMAFLYGIITSAIMFCVVIGFGGILSLLGFDLENASNIEDIGRIFSIPSMLILIIFQPLTEEFFYRGFLLEKLEKICSTPIAIALTSILFGLAHLSIGNVYPAFLTGIAGVILALLVIKTENLTAAIIAHVLFNIASFSVYIIGRSFV